MVVHAREVVVDIVHEPEDAGVVDLLALEQDGGSVGLDEAARPLQDLELVSLHRDLEQADALPGVYLDQVVQALQGHLLLALRGGVGDLIQGRPAGVVLHKEGPARAALLRRAGRGVARAHVRRVVDQGVGAQLLVAGVAGFDGVDLAAVRGHDQGEQTHVGAHVHHHVVLLHHGSAPVH